MISPNVIRHSPNHLTLELASVQYPIRYVNPSRANHERYRKILNNLFDCNSQLKSESWQRVNNMLKCIQISIIYCTMLDTSDVRRPKVKDELRTTILKKLTELNLIIKFNMDTPYKDNYLQLIEYYKHELQNI
jgi:hypothetical protein